VRCFAFSGAPGPVRDAGIRLGDLTAVIGSNDAGKSRLIRNLATALDASDPDGQTWSALVVEVEEGDVASLFRAVDRWDTLDATPRPTSDSLQRAQDPVGLVWESLRNPKDKAIHADSWAVVHRALRESRLFAFARDQRGDTWLHWCLALDENTPPGVAAAALAADA
jgi:hypothetical protein